MIPVLQRGRLEDNGTGLLKRTRGMGLCSGEPQISRMDADDSGAAERPLWRTMGQGS